MIIQDVIKLERERRELVLQLAAEKSRADAAERELLERNASFEEALLGASRLGKTIDALRARLALADGLAETAERLAHVIDSAGVDRLSMAVQLGKTAWFHKATDAMSATGSALERYRAASVPPAATGTKGVTS